ncbi:MAG: lipoyl(octanoyl) transferase LipB [Actinomycetia bacterium]|nr:lipoyl(octanoyl) transferase LipB [Actinomycetes bacterium]
MKINDLSRILDRMTSEDIPVLDSGIIPYQDAFDFQLALTGQIYERDLKGIILLLEHPPVITSGSNRSMENLLTPENDLTDLGIELIRSNRGGDITLHGPGQIICYPVFNLKFFGKDLNLFVHNLEQVIINVLLTSGIRGRRVKGHRGIFVEDKKIASIGLKVRKWISMHGFSLNVNIDLSYFKHILACGLKDYPQTSLSSLLKRELTINDVKERILKSFETVFNISTEKIHLK